MISSVNRKITKKVVNIYLLLTLLLLMPLANSAHLLTHIDNALGLNVDCQVCHSSQAKDVLLSSDSCLFSAVKQQYIYTSSPLPQIAKVTIRTVFARAPPYKLNSNF